MQPPPAIATPIDPRAAMRLLALRGVLAAAVFSLLTSLGAQVAVPLPPDGVPMTLQTLAVLCAALCIGPRLGTLSMLLYLAIGVLGAQVFAQGGKGFAALYGQTGGYLVGFLVCQPVVGAIARRPDGSIRGWLALVVAVLAGNAVIFGLGVPWLALVNGYGPAEALRGGFYPFIPGLILKGAAAVAIGRLAAPMAMRRIW